MTHYDVLGIARTADDAEIKKAYRRMIIAFHPDKYQGEKQFAADKTHEIIEAYTVLRDPAARRSYDRLLSAQLQNLSGTAQHLRKAARRSRKDKTDDAGAPVYSCKPLSPGLKAALIALAAVFFVFVVVLFLAIIRSIYPA